jgi:hypothetical protein
MLEEALIGIGNKAAGTAEGWRRFAGSAATRSQQRKLG